MAIIINPISIISLIAIIIMIGGIILSYVKKWMLTYALIFTNFIVFVISLFFESTIISELGFRPIYLSAEFFPQIYTLFTSMFVHSGFLHIFGNMLVFFFIGMAFEQRIGWSKFLVIYLLTGVFGSLTHSFLNLGSPIPLVGASGAIFGIMGAFAYAYPNDEVVMPIPLGFIMVFRKIKVIYAVLIFAALETVIVLIGGQSNTAHFAHFGGLVSGVIIAALLLKRYATKPTDSFTSNPQYRVSVSEVPRRPYDFSKLSPLATTLNLQQMLNKIQVETVPQVQEVWLDHFIEKSSCPVCHHQLKHFNRKIWCDNCDYSTTY